MCRRLFPSFGVALVLLASGCGGGSGDARLTKGEYERTAGPILVEAQSKLFKLGLAISRAPAPNLATVRMDALSEALRTAAARLGRLGPPTEIQGEHGDLVDGLRELGEAVDEARTKVGRQGFERMRGFVDTLLASEAARKLERAVRGIQAQGYSLRSTR